MGTSSRLLVAAAGRGSRATRRVVGRFRAGSSDRSREALVFTPRGGGPLRHSNFRQRIWLPPLRAAKLPLDLRIHDLRHTCAAILIAQGEHPKMIQHHLDHSSITRSPWTATATSFPLTSTR